MDSLAMLKLPNCGVCGILIQFGLLLLPCIAIAASLIVLARWLYGML